MHENEYKFLPSSTSNKNNNNNNNIKNNNNNNKTTTKIIIMISTPTVERTRQTTVLTSLAMHFWLESEMQRPSASFSNRCLSNCQLVDRDERPYRFFYSSMGLQTPLHSLDDCLNDSTTDYGANTTWLAGLLDSAISPYI